MAQLLETRCVSEGFFGSKHLFRVACIGDSMMYGAGSPPRQTLPAQLAQFMNSAFIDRFVWVDKFGEGSGQIWNAWTQLKSRTDTMRFDAVIFSVCQNDITLLDSFDLAYPITDEYYVNLWTEESYLTELSKNLFLDVKNHCQQSGIIPFIIFYTLIEGDRPIIDRMAQICAEVELPFADLLSFFKERTAINPLSYVATEFDGHPSALGHELAARGLVEMFRTSLASTRRSVDTEPEHVLPAAMTDLLAQGVEADAVLDWAAETLAAKQRAVRRARHQESRPLAARFEALAADVRTFSQRWRALRRLDVRVELADRPLSAVLPELHHLYALIRNTDELIYLLLNTPDEACLTTVGKRYLNGWYTEAGRLDFFRGDVAAEVVDARESLQALSVVCLLQRLAVDDRDDSWRPVSALGRLTLGSVMPELGRLGQFGQRLRAQLDLVSSSWPAVRSWQVQNEHIMRLWAILFHTVKAALWRLRDCETVFARGPELEAPVPAPWTSIDVVVEGQPDLAAASGLFLLILEASYRVPRRMPARETHWGNASKDRYSYHFEIPALLFGDLRIGVADDEPAREHFTRGTARISEIKIWSGLPGDPATLPQPAVEWRNPGEHIARVDLEKIELP